MTAKDANGNTVSGASVTLAVSTYAAGSSGGSAQGSLNCTNNTVTTSATGVAGFTTCDIEGTAAVGTYALKADQRRRHVRQLELCLHHRRDDSHAIGLQHPAPRHHR